jgi:hypothetical protein
MINDWVSRGSEFQQSVRDGKQKIMLVGLEEPEARNEPHTQRTPKFNTRFKISFFSEFK